MSRRGKQNISYIKPEEPAFLKRIKEQVGYKEGPNVDTKRQVPKFDEDDNDEERESDKPQVVVLKEGDIGEEELAEIMKEKADEEEKKKIEQGKITFKKPAKRQSSTDDASNVATTKKPRTEGSEHDKPKVTVKASTESRLLSFGSPEDEDSS